MATTFASTANPAVALTRRLPLISLTADALLPDEELTVPGFDDLPAALIDRAMAGGLRVVVMAAPLGHNLHRFGTEAAVVGLVRLPSGERGARLRGIRRVRILGTVSAFGSRSALVDPAAAVEVNG